MSPHKAARYLIAKDGAGAFQDFFLGAAGVSEKRFRRRNGPDPLNKINNCSHRRGEENQIASLNGLYRIFYASIYRSHFAGTAQDVFAVAAHHANPKTGRA